MMLHEESTGFAITVAQVAALIRENFGEQGRLSPLPSERDLNFRLDADDGRRYLVKLSNPSELATTIEFQQSLLRELAAREPELPLPRAVASRLGQDVVYPSLSSGEHRALRVFTYLEGAPIRDCKPGPQTFQSLGETIARFDRGLRSFGHPGGFVDLDWDLRHTLRSRKRLQWVADVSDRARLSEMLDRFEKVVQPCLPRLRAGVIHNDASDGNVLVDSSLKVCGLIDLGDAMHTIVISELAIACSYAIIESTAPLRDAAKIVAAYHAIYPIEELEIDLLFDLICARLCISATMAASRAKLAEENPYLLISQNNVWKLLRRLASIDPWIARATLRTAIGLPASSQIERYKSWICDQRVELGQVLPVDIAYQAPRQVPWGDATDRISVLTAACDPSGAQALWDARPNAKEVLGTGAWGEIRAIYAGDNFQSKLIEGKRREMHLGLDLFGPAGTQVRTPFAAVIVASALRTDPLDYGGVVVLRHQPTSDLTFYSIWGHLSHASASPQRIGQTLAAGDLVGEMGTFSENGGWMTHLHLQLAVGADDLGELEPEQLLELPGVGEVEFEALWREMFPEPNAFAGLPREAVSTTTIATDGLMQRRQKYLNPALSLAYQEPLAIVRGEGVWLIDAQGRRYLDAFNNVAHVGHCHPRVVRAQQEQAALLNTNTRYLHPLIGEYAANLASRFSAPLEVCSFTCSGSEANELAIRMARCVTGRKDVLVLDWAYHGNTQALLEISPYKYKRNGGSGRPETTHELALPCQYRLPEGCEAKDVGEYYAQMAEAKIAEMVAKGNPPAAVIVEAISSCGGQVVLPAGYLQRVFAAVRAAGGLCLVDEVQIGFGRVADHWWGFEEHSVVPDIVTLGKPIANGHPMGALITSRSIADRFANGMEYFNTFGGNPVSCAVALAVLETLQEERLLQNAGEISAILRRGLFDLAQRYEVIGDVRGRGLFLGIDLVTSRETKTPASALAKKLVESCRRDGVLVGTDGPAANVLKLRPPMIFRPEHAHRVLQTLERSLQLHASIPPSA